MFKLAKPWSRSDAVQNIREKIKYYRFMEGCTNPVPRVQPRSNRGLGLSIGLTLTFDSWCTPGTAMSINSHRNRLRLLLHVQRYIHVETSYMTNTPYPSDYSVRPFPGTQPSKKSHGSTRTTIRICGPFLYKIGGQGLPSNTDLSPVV